MAKFIKEIHELFNFLAGKNIASQQPPSRIDMALNEVIMSIYNEHYDHYVKTQKISDYLMPYKRLKVGAVTGGITTLPEDYKHMRFLETSAGVKIELVEDKFWTDRRTRKVGPPSLERPIARIEDTGEVSETKVIEVLPNTITSIKIYYFRMPKTAKYAFTVSGNRYVYDDTNSVDVDFNRSLLPQLALKLLSRFGINLREQQLIVYSEQAKTQESTK